MTASERASRPRVPVEEWSDAEWLVVIRVVPPTADISVGEMAVAEMRGACLLPIDKWDAAKVHRDRRA